MPETPDYRLLAAQALARVQEQTPLVHVIGNYVAMDIVANALLAVGASPVMAHAEEEVRDFAAKADALVVNIGTLSTSWGRAMGLAAQAAVEADTPWVLDPVGAGATDFRTQVALGLAGIRPSLIRGNAGEILALAQAAEIAGVTGSGPTGVDSTQPAQAARMAAQGLARRFGCVVLVTGPVDLAVAADAALLIDHGHAIMARVTGTGCALSALCGAMLAVEPEPLYAAAAAAAVFGFAGDLAAQIADGPASFRVALIDSLYGLDADEVAERALITPG